MNSPYDNTWWSLQMPSPVGKLTILCDDNAIKAVLWENDKISRVKTATNLQNSPMHPLLKRAQQQLAEYFAGERTRFDLPVEPMGTPFQKKVWDMLRRIPYGEAWDYKTLARKIGNEKACRAVGAANGRNPISIFIPCHRVIGANGTMTGFAGGIEKKEFLLNHEKSSHS